VEKCSVLLMPNLIQIYLYSINQNRATEAENEVAIALACKLEHRPMRTLEEYLFLELLITLI
jgi:hypothetical protein